MIEPLPRGRNPFDESGVEPRRRRRGPLREASALAGGDAGGERGAGPRGDGALEVGGASAATRSCGSARRGWPADCALPASPRATAWRSGMPNGIDWVLAFFATQLLGAVAVPVNTRFKDEEVAYVVEDCEARLHLPARGRAARRRAASRRSSGAPRTSPRSSTRAAPPAFPKGAMTSNENFLTNSENAFRCLSIDRSEGPGISTLVSVPLFHVTGCNSQLIPMLEFGGRVEILAGAARPRRLLPGDRAERRQPARVGARHLPRAAALPRRSRGSTSAACAGSPTAAPRSTRRWWRRS